MSNPYETSPYNQATTPATPPSTAPEVTTDERQKMGRRALIAAAGLGVVGVAAYEAPKILEGAAHLTEQQLQNAINYGRKQLANELLTIEEVGIDTAIDIANITHGAVDIFVLPIAKLFTAISEGALDIAIAATQVAYSASQMVGLKLTAMQSLQGILTDWKAKIDQFPLTLQALNNVDTQQAKKYLVSLKGKLEQEKTANNK